MAFHTSFRSPLRAVCGAAGAGALLFGGLLAAPIASANDITLDTRLGQRVLAAGKTQRIFLRVSLEGIAHGSRKERSPVNIALVLDRSGSMRGKKLAQAKQAALLALSRLDRSDVTAIIAYDDRVQTVLAATRLSDRADARARVRALEAGGRTALYAGVKRGLGEVGKFLSADRVNRLILLSDGLANVGPSTPAQVARLGQIAAGQGISITTIGLGLGYNEDLMARLAGASDGNHAFVEHAEDLVDIFDKEFADVLSVVAQDIEIIIKCRAGFRPIRVLGRSAQITGPKVKLRLNQAYGGQRKYVILEVEVAADKAVAGVAEIAGVEVSYTGMGSNSREKETATIGAKFSTSKDEVDASIDADVMTAVATQIATVTSEKAVKLRDQGDREGARKLLEENATYLRDKARQYKAPALERMSRQNAGIADQLSDSDWSKSRKQLRARQHRQKSQQSY
jgi:Ca-activated chloride channel family protein